MTYVKSTLVGIVTALLAVAIVVLAMLRLEVSEGSGAMFVSISSWQVLLAALVGFLAGFWFMRRRSRARHA
jgi:hypothetical protein